MTHRDPLMIAAMWPKQEGISTARSMSLAKQQATARGDEHGSALALSGQAAPSP